MAHKKALSVSQGLMLMMAGVEPVRICYGGAGWSRAIGAVLTTDLQSAPPL